MPRLNKADQDTIIQCYCGERMPKKDLLHHMQKVHGLTRGYANISRTGNRKGGWCQKKRGVE